MVDDIIFPPNIDYGSVRGFEFKTSVVEGTSGFEFRDVLWSLPKKRYKIKKTGLSAEDRDALKVFHAGRRGAAYAFWLRDDEIPSVEWDGTYIRGVFIPIPGRTGVFRPAIEFRDAIRPCIIPIFKVDNMVVKEAGVTYGSVTIVETMAEVEFADDDYTDKTWSGDLYIAVRFASDAMSTTQNYPVSFDSQDIELVEDRIKNE